MDVIATDGGTTERDEVRRRLVAGLSLEATPKQLAKVAAIGQRLPAGTEIYLPALSASRAEETAATAARLVALGLGPVPHLPARRLASRRELDDTLERYAAAGVDRVLLIAGDVDRPAGPFTSTLDVLASGRLAAHGIRRLGVAGHPEGHPAANAAALSRALAEKAAYARETGSEMWIVTQFVFEASPFLRWSEALQAAGVALPIRCGLPGPAKMHTLLAYALQCGVGTSARVLARRPDAARMLTRWSPDALVDDLAAHEAATPASAVAGLHLFPFGGLDAALDWRARNLAASHAPGDAS